MEEVGMNKSGKTWLYWVPRVLAILFALFISLFALDAFAVEKPFLEQLGGFLIHLIPTALVVAAAVIAWKRGVIGGVLFILIGAAYVFQTLYDGWVLALTFGGLPILTGILFILEGLAAKRAPQPGQASSRGGQ
jgi:hypothetical protein